MADVLLAIDAGTSAVKVCLFDREGQLLRSADRPTPMITVCHGWAEIDSDECWNAIVESVRGVINPDDTVLSIGLTGTCPTIVLMDEELQPVRNAILYLDNRGRSEIAGVARAVGGPDAFFAQTGNRLGLSVCIAATLRWVIHEEPATWSRVRHIGFLTSFIGAKLTGHLAVDSTHASYSGLFDLRGDKMAWHADLCRDLEIDIDRLVPIIPSYAQVGTVTAEVARIMRLTQGTPVAVGAADTAAAALAVNLVRPRSAFESIGTSGVLTFCLDEPDFDESFLNRCHVRPGLWLAHGAMSTLGGSLTWLSDKVWPETSSFTELEQLVAESQPGANRVLFLPYLSGERSPIWDADASGCWIGLRLDTKKADMVRAVFEGGAYGLRQILSRAEKHWGWRPNSLISVGGGTRSRIWHQIKADILGVRYLPADLPDAAALGAATLGGIAAGVYEGIDDPNLPKIRPPQESVTPNPGKYRKVYDDMSRIYEDLYPSLKDCMSRIAQIGLSAKLT
jgi:xylulokinase